MTQRLQWLEEALSFAEATGALHRDRAERARRALQWADVSAAGEGAGDESDEQPV